MTIGVVVACGGASKRTPGAGDFDADVQDICEANFSAPCNPMRTWETCEYSLYEPREEAIEVGCGAVYDTLVDCWARNGSVCNQIGLVHVNCEDEEQAWRACLEQ